MANKEESFIPYFKIRWACKEAWSLTEAACLSCGVNPEEKNADSVTALTNKVINERFLWLKNKANKEDIVSFDDHSFHKWSILRLWHAKKIQVDSQLLKICAHIWDAHHVANNKKQAVNYKVVSRAVYREAGKLVCEQYPYATREEIADFLKDLPEYYNNAHLCQIEKLDVTTLIGYFNGINSISGKLPQDEKQVIQMDLKNIVERL